MQEYQTPQSQPIEVRLVNDNHRAAKIFLFGPALNVGDDGSEPAGTLIESTITGLSYTEMQDMLRGMFIEIGLIYGIVDNVSKALATEIFKQLKFTKYTKSILGASGTSEVLVVDEDIKEEKSGEGVFLEKFHVFTIANNAGVYVTMPPQSTVRLSFYPICTTKIGNGALIATDYRSPIPQPPLTT